MHYDRSKDLLLQSFIVVIHRNFVLICCIHSNPINILCKSFFNFITKQTKYILTDLSPYFLYSSVNLYIFYLFSNFSIDISYFVRYYNNSKRKGGRTTRQLIFNLNWITSLVKEVRTNGTLIFNQTFFENTIWDNSFR